MPTKKLFSKFTNDCFFNKNFEKTLRFVKNLPRNETFKNSGPPLEFLLALKNSIVLTKKVFKQKSAQP